MVVIRHSNRRDKAVPHRIIKDFLLSFGDSTYLVVVFGLQVAAHKFHAFIELLAKLGCRIQVLEILGRILFTKDNLMDGLLVFDMFDTHSRLIHYERTKLSLGLFLFCLALFFFCRLLHLLTSFLHSLWLCCNAFLNMNDIGLPMFKTIKHLGLILQIWPNIGICFLPQNKIVISLKNI